MLIAFLITTILSAGLVYFIKNTTISHLITLGYTLLVGALSVFEYLHINETQLEYFTPDALGLTFLFVLSLLAFITALHYRTYAVKRKEKNTSVAIHNAAYILFLAALVGVNLSNHFGLLWVFVEATTLTGAVLIYHDRDQLALEAVWKYIFICSISIALAFAGILFLSIASQEASSVELSFDSVKQLATTMNPIWLKACFIFIVTGFSVKMGVFPMFNVDIDAKDTSPSPVGGLLSSVLLNAGFLAIFRFYSAFSGTAIQPWMQHLLMISGFLSIVFAASYLLKVKNYKRIFAYSSMEHAGLILLAVSMGKAGYFAALLHIVFHSFVKSSLFYQIGQVHRFYKSKMDGLAGGYFFKNPIGGLVLILGLFSVVALPPSGLFISEFLIFKSFIASGYIWLSLAVMLLLTLIMYTLSKSMMRLLFIAPPEDPEPKVTEKIPVWESGSQLLLLGGTIYLGIAQPPFFIDFIHQALVLIP